jgi:hypothetical protein
MSENKGQNKNEKADLEKSKAEGGNEGHVIEMPKKHTFRKRLRDRAHDQRSALILSIAAVLILTVFVNQWFANQSNGGQSNSERGIASFSPSINGPQNIKWEHELALQLAVEKGLSEAALAEKPTLRDELVFGALQGRYGVKLKAGLIEALEFLEAHNGEEPLEIPETARFLNKYSSVWSRPFSEARLRGIQEGHETYQLLDRKMTFVGEVVVMKDAKGRMMSLEFKSE